MESILEASSRTVAKIIKRLQLACFECGWNECSGDLHHILPTAKGGKDTHDNLTYLCPNCHRKAHNGLLSEFKTLEEVVGESWKLHYNVVPNKNISREFKGKCVSHLPKNLELARAVRKRNVEIRATEKIALLREAKLDVTQYGWIQKAAAILGITPQRVVWYLKKHAPEMMKDAKQRIQNFQVRIKK